MKKIFITILFLGVSYSFAGDFSSFKTLDKKSAEVFAGDIGSLMGSGISYTARSLGFSGFDMSFKTAYQLKPSRNSFMPSQRAFSINYGQVELGMPYRIDAFIRTGFGDSLTIVGGGIKYGLWKIRDGLYQTNGMFVLNSNMANNPNFYAIQYGAQMVFSMNMGTVRPFVNLGFDNTTLNIQNADDLSLVGKRFYAFNERFSGGFRFKFKWVNIATAYTFSHDSNLLDGTFSVRF